MPLSEFEALADQFQPREDWAQRLAADAVEAGMKYVVLTTRHHDGYALFDSEHDDFNAAQTGPGRDLVAEYVEALREAGLGVGFYYSLMNWRWRGYWDAEQYPDEAAAMIDQSHAQIEELMTNYGEIDILWFDGGAPAGQRTPGQWAGEPMTADKAEFWRADQISAMVRELQPKALLNNRSGLDGDFGTPEQRVQAEREGRPWETCMTLNYAPGWGYLRHSLADKSPGQVLYHLVDAVRLGGNFLLNVGPRPDGLIDERELSVLRPIGEWMRLHGEAIYGTRPESIYPVGGHPQGPMYHYGMWTCKGSTAYFTIFYYPEDYLIVSKVAPAIRSAELLTTSTELTVEPLSNNRFRISGLPTTPPDPIAPVLKVQFEGPPRGIETRGAEWLAGGFAE
jgi:alpha-L-fucosidase